MNFLSIRCCRRCTTDKRSDANTRERSPGSYTHQESELKPIKSWLCSYSFPQWIIGGCFINCGERFFPWLKRFTSPSLWFTLPTSCLFCYGPLTYSMSLFLLNMKRRTTYARIFYNVANGAICWSTCPYFDILTFCVRRKLNDTEKANYIRAVKCLQARPPLYQNIAAVRTRFDEFQALHIDVADRVHTTVNLRYCFITAGGI